MNGFDYVRHQQAPDEPFLDIDITSQDLSQLRQGNVPELSEGVPSSLDVLAVIFDLEGFTTFCDQGEPHLFVPRFVTEFRMWLFGQLADALVDDGPNAEPHRAGAVALTAPPPMFKKFLGDGFLLLWAADEELLTMLAGYKGALAEHQA